MTDWPKSAARGFAAMTQQHRMEIGKLSLQLSVYRQQLIDAGIEPDDRDDEEIMRLWRAAASTVSAASAFVVELGSAKELLDENMVTLSRSSSG